MLHPTTRLLAWIAFAIAIPWLSIQALLAASVGIAVMVWASGAAGCWRLVRRTRVLLIALIVLYAFATPGAPLIAGWTQWNPTVEGIRAGGLQAWRLLLMISALALLLARMQREQWLAGIYILLLPLKLLGVPVARIAVRLWLTLHYVETAPKADSLSARWESALTLPDEMPASIALEVPAFTRWDAGFILGFGVLLALALW